MPKPKTDKAFLRHIGKHAPEVHNAELDFDAVMAHVVRANPDKLDLRPPRKRKTRIRRTRPG